MDYDIYENLYVSKKEIDKIIREMRSKLTPGTKIRMIEMRKEFFIIGRDEEGKVLYVDDWGNIFVHWDNGRIISIIPYEDKFEII